MKYHNQEKVIKRHQNNDDPCIMAWDHYIESIIGSHKRRATIDNEKVQEVQEKN